MRDGKPGRISAGPVRELHVPGSPGAETRVHSALHLEKALLSLVKRAGPIPSPLHLGLEAERDSPPKMLQLQERSKFIIVPRNGSSVILSRFSRTTGILQLHKPALGL